MVDAAAKRAKTEPQDVQTLAEEAIQKSLSSDRFTESERLEALQQVRAMVVRGVRLVTVPISRRRDDPASCLSDCRLSNLSFSVMIVFLLKSFQACSSWRMI